MGNLKDDTLSEQLDDAINNDGMIGAANPHAMEQHAAIDLGNVPEIEAPKNLLALDETKTELYGAIDKINATIDNMLHSKGGSPLEELASVHTALVHGVNFLEHVEQVLKDIKKYV